MVASPRAVGIGHQREHDDSFQDSPAQRGSFDQDEIEESSPLKRRAGQQVTDGSTADGNTSDGNNERSELQDSSDDCTTSSSRYSTSPGDMSVWRMAWKMRYLFLLIWITTLQYGAIAPSLVYLSQSFFAEGDANCEATPDSLACKEGAANLAFWTGASHGVSNSIAWVVALTVGSMSDSIGRRPLFRTKAIASIVPILMLALHVFGGATLWFYLIASPIYEAFDVNGVFLAFMSDMITHPDLRSQAYGTLSVGYVIGGFAVLPIAALLSARAAVVVSLAAAVAKLIYMWTVFPETSLLLKDAGSRQRPPSLCEVFVQAKRVFSRNSFIVRMVLIVCFSGVASVGVMTTFIPTMTGYLGMHKKETALIGGIAGLSTVLGMVILMPTVVKWAGNIRSLKASLLFGVVFPIILPQCTEPAHLMLLVFCFVAPIAIQIPIISAVKSNLVGQNEQGLVQGALAAIRVLAVAIAEAFFGWFYRFATQKGTAPRSSTYYPLGLASALAFASFLIALTLPCTPPPPPSDDKDGACAVSSSPNAKSEDTLDEVEMAEMGAAARV